MSTRLSAGGRLIDKSKQISFRFNGKHMTGYAGDSLASALLANDQMLVGRSFKYHRPRGVVASGSEEPNGLVNLGEGGQFEPNQRITTTELFDGLAATSQNHWPSLDFDVGVINNSLARFCLLGSITKCSSILDPFGNMYTSRSFATRRVWEKPRKTLTTAPMSTCTVFMMLLLLAAGLRATPPPTTTTS